MQSAPLKEGDRIEMVLMPDDPCPIEPGDTGTVTSYSCFVGKHWSIGVAWDSGRTLSIIHGVDQVRVIS